MTLTPTARIGRALYRIVQRMGAEIDLLSILGSMGDTLDEEEIAELLEDYLQTGQVIHEQH